MSPVAKASLFVGEVLASWVLLTTDLYLYWIFLCQNFLVLLLFFSKKGQTLPEHKSWPSSGSRHWALEHCSTWLCAKNLDQRPLQWNLAAVWLKPCAGSDPGKWGKKWDIAFIQSTKWNRRRKYEFPLNHLTVCHYIVKSKAASCQHQSNKLSLSFPNFKNGAAHLFLEESCSQCWVTVSMAEWRKQTSAFVHHSQ